MSRAIEREVSRIGPTKPDIRSDHGHYPNRSAGIIIYSNPLEMVWDRLVRAIKWSSVTAKVQPRIRD